MWSGPKVALGATLNHVYSNSTEHINCYFSARLNMWANQATCVFCSIAFLYQKASTYFIVGHKYWPTFKWKSLLGDQLSVPFTINFGCHVSSFEIHLWTMWGSCTEFRIQMQIASIVKFLNCQNVSCDMNTSWDIHDVKFATLILNVMHYFSRCVWKIVFNYEGANPNHEMKLCVIVHCMLFSIAHWSAQLIVLCFSVQEEDVYWAY